MKEFYPEGTLINTPKNDRYLNSREALNTAFKSGIILEAVAEMCDAEHNLYVDLGIMKGIIPRFEGAIGIKEGVTRDIALISRVGKPVCFLVDSFKTDQNGKTVAVLSRRRAQEACKKQFLSKLSSGDIINARVTHLESFGAFCDIGCGNAALLPIDLISVSRISHPSDRFGVGDNISVIVKNTENGKITLSLKELLGTWEENVAMFSSGQTVMGIVRSVEEYGVFIELTPNLAGLAEPRADIYIGDSVCVYIKSINPEKMKVKLVIIDNSDKQTEIPLKFFYSGNKIDRFDYSPAGACKEIYTLF